MATLAPCGSLPLPAPGVLRARAAVERGGPSLGASPQRAAGPLLCRAPLPAQDPGPSRGHCTAQAWPCSARSADLRGWWLSGGASGLMAFRAPPRTAWKGGWEGQGCSARTGSACEMPCGRQGGEDTDWRLLCSSHTHHCAHLSPSPSGARAAQGILP